jgi:hypothetical protein
MTRRRRTVIVLAALAGTAWAMGLIDSDDRAPAPG